MTDLQDAKYRRYFEARHNFFVFKTQSREEIIAFNEVLPLAAQEIFNGKRFTDCFRLGFDIGLQNGEMPESIVIPAVTVESFVKVDDENYVVKRGMIKRELLSGRTVRQIGFCADIDSALCTHSVLPSGIDGDAEINAVFFTVTGHNFLETSGGKLLRECFLGVRAFEKNKLKAYRVSKGDIYNLYPAEEIPLEINLNGNKITFGLQADELSEHNALIVYDGENTAVVPLRAERAVTENYTVTENLYIDAPKNRNALSIVKDGIEYTDFFDGAFIKKASAANTDVVLRLHADSVLSCSLYGKYLIEHYGRSARIYVCDDCRLRLYGVIWASANITKIQYAANKFFCVTEKQTYGNVAVYEKGAGLYLNYADSKYAPFKNMRIENLFLSQTPDNKIAAIYTHGGSLCYGVIGADGALTERKLQPHSDNSTVNTVFSSCFDAAIIYGKDYSGADYSRLIKISNFDTAIAVESGTFAKINQSLKVNPAYISFGKRLYISSRYKNSVIIDIFAGQSEEMNLNENDGNLLLSDRGALRYNKKTVALLKQAENYSNPLEEVSSFEASQDVVFAGILSDLAVAATESSIYAIPFLDDARHISCNINSSGQIVTVSSSEYINPMLAGYSKVILEYSFF